jgi:hypothetical protein
LQAGVRKRARQCVKHLPDSLRPLLDPSIHPQSAAELQRIPRVQLCGARNRNKTGTCKREAGWGTDHLGFGRCKLHGGSHRNGRKAAAKQEMAAQSLVMGIPVDIDPMEALLQCVRIAAGEVIYASEQLKSLRLEDAIVNYEEVEESEEFGTKTKKTSDSRLHIWIETRQQAMDRLARYSKMAIDSGIAERQVVLAEKIGGLMGRLIQGVLGDLDLSAKQKQLAPEVVRQHLSVLEGQAQAIGAGS